MSARTSVVSMASGFAIDQSDADEAMNLCIEGHLEGGGTGAVCLCQTGADDDAGKRVALLLHLLGEAGEGRQVLLDLRLADKGALPCAGGRECPWR
nr:hypothetical protein [uncultured Cohaesibacter sp.]